MDDIRSETTGGGEEWFSIKAGGEGRGALVSRRSRRGKRKLTRVNKPVSWLLCGPRLARGLGRGEEHPAGAPLERRAGVA